MSNRFGHILRAEREGSGMSLRAFAEKIGVSPTYLSQVERGNAKPPTKKRALEMAKQLNMNPDYFIMEAGHLPDDLVEIIRREPGAISELIRITSGLSFSQIESLTQMARRMKSK